MKTILFVIGMASVAHAANPVFDLVANRSLAHAQRQGGLYIAAGAPGFAKYVRFGRPIKNWTLRAVEDGKKVALASTQAVLEVPLTAAQAKATNLVIRLKAPVASSVRANVGGKAGVAVALQPGWQTATVPLAGLDDGENRILLVFANSGMLGGKKASAAVEWLQVGGAAPTEGDPPKFSDGNSLTLQKGDALAWYAMIPEGAKLEAPACVKASATTKSGTVEELARLQGQVARLDLVAVDNCKIAAAALTTPGEPPTAKKAAPPKYVIFWMTDSTRADKYRAINPKTRVETPVMDAFVKKATLFKTAYVQGNESRVSHASVWTGMYPAQHGFIPSKAVLNGAFTTLGEVAKAASLHVAGYMANGYITGRWGFADGFDALHNAIHQGGGLKAEDIVKWARGFLSQRSKNPFFLYLGTIDAHVSWRAHEPWIKKYDPEPYSGPYVKALLDPALDKIVAGQIKLTDRDRVRIKALYDSDISYNDHHFGELLKTLEAAGILEQTMIVLTADHGEEFWEHGRIGHGQSIREELVHVPLVIHYPPLFPARAVEEGAEIVDVLPTIAEALGQKIPEGAQGESLIGLAQGVGAGYPRPAIASQYELAHTMRLGKWKLWVGGSGEAKLFDAAADPLEEKELSKERPLERRFVGDALNLWMAYQAKWKKTRWGVASNLKPAFASDLER